MGIMMTFLRGLDDWLAREDPEVSAAIAAVAADADHAEAMEQLGVCDGDEADEAYNRLQRIEERNEHDAAQEERDAAYARRRQRVDNFLAARSLIHRPTF